MACFLFELCAVGSVARIRQLSFARFAYNINIFMPLRRNIAKPFTCLSQFVVGWYKLLTLQEEYLTSA